MKMEIGSIGYNYYHDAEFLMDRPNGSGCHLLLLIKTTARFEINGSEFIVKPNSFVLLSPQTPCKYRALEDEYTDDWMYFIPEKVDLELIEGLGIPFDTIVYLGNMDELSQIIHMLAYEHYSAEIYNAAIERRYMEILFYKLSRIIQSKSYISSASFVERNYRFTQLRTQIYTMPESVPDVEEMASQLGMSRSGFQHLYKKMFGVSVMTDVITGRLDRAKRLLSSTNLTVKEIAEKCGYSSEYNFMRQFKSRFGKTPTEYRKCI